MYREQEASSQQSHCNQGREGGPSSGYPVEGSEPLIQPSIYRNFTKLIILATSVLSSSLMSSGHCWLLQLSCFQCVKGTGSRLMDMQRGPRCMGDAGGSDPHCLLLAVDVISGNKCLDICSKCSKCLRATVPALRHREQEYSDFPCNSSAMNGHSLRSGCVICGDQNKMNMWSPC